MSQQLSAGVSLALAQRGGGGQPSLALNFLTEQLDSRITFSRGTQAMRYGQDGTLQYAPNNLLTYSNQADNAAWTKSNSFVQTNLLTYSQDFSNAIWAKSLVTVTPDAVTAPDGTLTADQIAFSSASGYLFQEYAITTVGTVLTYSTWVKAASSTTVNLIILQNGGTNSSVTVPITTEWQRVSVSFTTNTSSGAPTFVRAQFSPNANTPTFFAWGAQLVQGSVPGDYRATTSAALPVLYADYTGALRARKLCVDSATAPHYVISTGSTVVGQTYTMSARFKQGEYRYGCLSAHGLVNGAVYFDLQSGTVSSAQAAISASTITALANGWYLCTGTYTATGTTQSADILVSSLAGSASFTGDGSSGIYIADAQLTPGYLPLAVTETTSAAVYGPRFDYDPGTLVTQNLLTYSEPTTANLTSSNNTSTASVSIAGFSNSIQFGDNSLQRVAYKNQTLTPVQHTISVFVQMDDGAAPAPSNFNTSGDFSLVFENNLVTTTLTTTLVSGSIYRISAAVTAAGTASANFGVIKYTGQSARTFRVTGFQVNRGTLLPYAATTSATVQTCAARGELLEDARTNLATFSNTFSDASWVALGTKNVAASAILSPEGVANAWTLTDSSAVAFDGIQKGITVAADGTTYTGSIYILKTYGGTSTTFGVNMGISGGTTVSNNVRINTDTGAVLLGTATVTNDGAYWRVACPITNNSTAGNVNLSISLYPATAAYNSATDSAAATGSATIYQAQVEVGAMVTSPIITVGSTGTRNADADVMNVSTSWFNTSEGTIYLEYLAAADPAGTFRTQLQIKDGGGTNYLQIRNQNPTGTTAITNNQVVAASVAQADLSSTSFAATTVVKTALGYKLNDFAASTNGAAALTDVSGTVPTGLATLNMGGGAFTIGRTWVRALKVYRRKFSSTEIQRLTA